MWENTSYFFKKPPTSVFCGNLSKFCRIEVIIVLSGCKIHRQAVKGKMCIRDRRYPAPCWSHRRQFPGLHFLLPCYSPHCYLHSLAMISKTFFSFAGRKSYFCFFTNATSSTSCIFSTNTSSVSYTHLDVYKRQVIDLFVSSSSLHAFCIRRLIIYSLNPVSYTHLDVSKRQDTAIV